MTKWWVVGGVRGREVSSEAGGGQGGGGVWGRAEDGAGLGGCAAALVEMLCLLQSQWQPSLPTSPAYSANTIPALTPTPNVTKPRSKDQEGV